MRTLPKPGVSIGEIVRTCASSYADADKRKRFMDSIPLLERHAAEYDTRAKKKDYCGISANDDSLAVSPQEMVELYTRKLAGGNRECRRLYDRIKDAPPDNCCPYCGVGFIRNLDHFLPKSSASLHAATPVNLVPSCSECNLDKASKLPSSNDSFVLHPYYDGTLEEEWLFASVDFRNGGHVAIYSICYPPHWSESIRQRTLRHFQVFDLGRKCSNAAANELSSKEHLFKSVKNINGEDGLRSHLEREYQSAKAFRANYWKTALYRALSSDDEFIGRC